MDKFKLLLEDLVGIAGGSMLAKRDKMSAHAPAIMARIASAWVNEHLLACRPGVPHTVLFPGTRDRFLTFRKSDGSVAVDVISCGKVERTYGSADIDVIKALSSDILDRSGVPVVKAESNSDKVVGVVGPLADKLVKAFLKPKKQKDMEEAGEPKESKGPCEIDKEYYDAAAKDKQVKSPVPSVESYEQTKARRKTQPYQKGEIKEKQQKDMEEDHEIQESTSPSDQAKEYYDAAAKDKQVKSPVPSVESYEQTKARRKTQPYQKGELSPSLVSAVAKLKTMRGGASDKSGPRSPKLHAAVNAAKNALHARKVKGRTSGMFQEPLKKPYVSEAQRRWAHTAAGKKALGGEKAVEHWDKESKGKNLPEKVSKMDGGMSPSAEVATAAGTGAAGVPGGFARAEMPSGAGIPKQPKQPTKPIDPSKAPATAAAKQAQASARGKQPLPKIPKQAKVGANMAMKAEAQSATLSKVSVTDLEAFAPCQHCGKSQFKRSDGSFDPCLCFAVEKGSSEPFAKLVKTAAGYSVEFRPDADPESTRAFLLTLKLGLLARKISEGR
jgi:hypothetical protein